MIRRIANLALIGLFVLSGNIFAASEEAAERVARGRKFLEQGNVDAALEELQKAATADPAYGAAQLNLGYAYERANKTDEAIGAYLKAIELEPRSFYARNNLAVLYDKKEMYDEAIAEFQIALKEQPGNATALKNLETAKKNKTAAHERDDTIARAEKEVKTKPDDPKPAYHLARVYANYGKQEAAIESLGRAIRRGYKDFAYMKTDPAFIQLRENRDFQLLLLKK